MAGGDQRGREEHGGERQEKTVDVKKKKVKVKLLHSC
jgi:hypothetical protein